MLTNVSYRCLYAEMMRIKRIFQQVPGLFQRDSMEELLQGLVSAMESECPDRNISFDNLLEFFESRIVNNLHVVLCFAPVREYFIYQSVSSSKLI